MFTRSFFTWKRVRELPIVKPKVEEKENPFKKKNTPYQNTKESSVDSPKVEVADTAFQTMILMIYASPKVVNNETSVSPIEISPSVTYDGGQTGPSTMDTSLSSTSDSSGGDSSSSCDGGSD